MGQREQSKQRPIAVMSATCACAGGTICTELIAPRPKVDYLVHAAQSIVCEERLLDLWQDNKTLDF
jgi:hypothetical protein